MTANGRVFACGIGKHNVLGQGSRTDAPNADTPVPVPGAKDIVQMATGAVHMIALDSAGKVWTWGAGGRSSPIGRSGENASPGVVGGPLADAKVTQVAAGRRHGVAMDSQGRVYTWGNGHYGALGTGGRRDQPEPVEVTLPGVAVQVAAGSDHTLVLLEDGTVLAFGSEEAGQCGAGFASRCLRTPQAVNGLQGKGISKIAAGEYHSVALGGDGKVYMWGANKDAQLGTGGRTNAGAPREVEALHGHQVVDVKGGAHTLFLTAEGRLFACGRGREGQLGRGDGLESVAGFREEPVEVTSLVKAATADGMSGTVRIVSIGAGRHHSAAIVSNE